MDMTRFEELLQRMVAPGKFPQISASEAHEVVADALNVLAQLRLYKAQETLLPPVTCVDNCSVVVDLKKQVKNLEAQLGEEEKQDE